MPIDSAIFIHDDGGFKELNILREMAMSPHTVEVETLAAEIFNVFPK